MKKSSFAIVVGLVALVGFAWFMQFGNVLSNNKSAGENLNNAAVYTEKGLYQKAIVEYENALKIRPDQQVHIQMLDTCLLGFEDDVVTAKEYSAAMLNYCKTYPDDLEGWERLLSFNLEFSSYDTAFQAAKACLDAEVSGETVNELLYSICYALRVSSKVCVEYTRNENGYYVLSDGNGWGVVDPDGARIFDFDYAYISPFNSKNTALFISEKGARLIDEDSIVEAILPEGILRAGMYGDGLLPVCSQSGQWRYLDCASGQYVDGIYQMASGYQNGVAAVKRDGVWMLIDTTGAAVSELVYDDIKLSSDGSWIHKGVMIASVGGAYGIYDKTGEPMEGFSCVDADVCMGSYIAYQDSTGKWGYVNKSGKVIIEPCFVQAKSFSSGLAAVSDGERWGFIDKQGNLVIGYQFLDADYFSESGVCLVSSLQDQYHMITLRFPEVLK